MEYETVIQRDYKGAYCLKIIVPIKHTLQIQQFVSELDTGSNTNTDWLNIVVCNDNKNVLRYIDYELGKFISNIDFAERCYNELFMEVKA